MTRLTEIAFQNIPYDFFTDVELENLLKGSDDSRYALTKRAIAKGEIIHIRKGLYCLAAKYQRKGLNLYVLAQKIYGPSYVSLESALSYHGYIPEAVHSITNVSIIRTKEFDTPLGLFSYIHIPLTDFYNSVSRVTTEIGNFLIASPLRALIDYVYVYKKNWRSLRSAVEYLRMDDTDFLKTVSSKEINELDNSYSNRRVHLFIQALKKEAGYEH